ncbi:hypothetical protein ACKWTF_011502 [Chironomus riparius]
MKTSRGGYFVFYNSQKFVQHKRNDIYDVTYYRCNHYQNLKCHARIKVDSMHRQAYLLEGHSHLPMIKLNANTVDISSEIEQTTTGRGGISLLHQGVKFIKCGQKNDTTRYRCQYYANQCRCRIAVDGKGVALMTNFHNHDLLDTSLKKSY